MRIIFISIVKIIFILFTQNVDYYIQKKLLKNKMNGVMGLKNNSLTYFSTV